MQQIPFIYLFMDLFKTALHVSGDKLAHLQENVLNVYTDFGTMQRYWWQGDNVTLSPVGTNIGALYQNLYIHSETCSWRWASLSPETCRAVLIWSIKRSIKRICCILLVVHIAVLMKHRLTNIKSKKENRPVGADGQMIIQTKTHRQADMTQPIAAFHYFANEHKKKSKHYLKINVHCSH